MDSTVAQQLNAGWGKMIQQMAANNENDARAMTALVSRALVTADDPEAFTGMNIAARMPTTLEHPLYPGVSK